MEISIVFLSTSGWTSIFLGFSYAFPPIFQWLGAEPQFGFPSPGLIPATSRPDTEEYDSDYNGELDFWEFRKVLRTPTMSKKLGFLGLGCDEAESLLLGGSGRFKIRFDVL